LRRAQAAAEAYDKELLALSPEHFGTAENRLYKFHSIVGLAANSPGNAPWESSDPIQTQTCSTFAPNAGAAHQFLSKLSGGYRYPICRNDDFTSMFRAVAESVVVQSHLSCSWKIPAPPPGEELDYSK